MQNKYTSTTPKQLEKKFSMLNSFLKIHPLLKKPTAGGNVKRD